MHGSLIRNTKTAYESEKAVEKGVIHSSYLSGFQKTAVFEGILKTAEPKGQKSAPELMKAKGTATPYRDGTVHYPGAGSH